jgi:hypothetical protein
MKRSFLFPARTTCAVLAVLGLSLLGACSSSPPLFLSDGRPTTQIQCPDGAQACSQQAQASCGGAFDVVRQSTDNGVYNLIYACRRAK